VWVGPNGCGKSNIIDAVRWVLGESKASELRGESIQDVIFKAPATASRSAVPVSSCFFDNAEGRAAGQWSQYAEITVKRVLDEKVIQAITSTICTSAGATSSICSSAPGSVRAAYAIIGQGMISRIVESKPDELRFFLEEAAGLPSTRSAAGKPNTAWKMRARTSRASDDIRNELETQVSHLQAQASVAQQYRDLHQQVSRKQTLLWLKKRNDAQHDGRRLARQVEEAINRVEAETANLREIEARVEHAREKPFFRIGRLARGAGRDVCGQYRGQPS